MTIKDFNTTLFELTDEMMTLIKPSTVMTTGYTVFKSMYASNPENDMAVKAFWEVAKDNKELIEKNDMGAMADVLRGIVPVPGMVDDVWHALSEENRGIVADYIRVLYDQAKALELPEIKEESSSTTMYSMYNDIWRDFLVLVSQHCSDVDGKKQKVDDAIAKMDAVLAVKGRSTDMLFAVLSPCMQKILPGNIMKNEADILRLCMPPSNCQPITKSDQKAMRKVAFPFHRELPFSDLLGVIVSSKQEKLAMFWHYIKLFTVCVKECPPEIVGMMNQFVGFFHHHESPDTEEDRLRRDAPAVLTK